MIAYLAVVKAVRTACSLVIGGTVLVATFGAHTPRHALAVLRKLREAAPVEPVAAEAPVVAP